MSTVKPHGPIWLAALMLLVTSAFYFLTPLLTRVQRFPVNTHLTPVEVAEVEDAAGPATWFLRKTKENLALDGFELLGHVRQTNSPPGVSFYLIAFANREAEDLALIALWRAGDEEHPQRTHLLEFIRQFDGGTSLETSDSSELGVFPLPPGNEVWQFPDVGDARRLYRIHGALAGRSGRRATPLPVPGAELAALGEALDGALRSQIDTGYLEIEPSDGTYRPTWKGAFLMTWKLLPPWRWLRHVQRDREAARILAELGV